MSVRVWIEKVMLVLSLRALDVETLARWTYEEQKSQHLPGLAWETEKICQDLKIEDCNSTNLSKKDYKYILLQNCHRQNEKILRAQAQGKENCNQMEAETCGKKEHLSEKSIFEVREIYKSRFKMHPFAGNFSHNRRFMKSDYLCRCLKEKETEGHLISGKCPVYRDIRDKFDNLEDIKDLVEFFQEVLARRDAMDEEEDI
jgi:hypothetical protein